MVYARSINITLIATVVAAGSGFASLFAESMIPADKEQLRTFQPLSNSEDIAFVMGGSGHPFPPAAQVAGVDAEYIQHLYPGYTPEPFFYPANAEGSFTPPESEPLDTSVAQGLEALNRTIMENIKEGNNIVVTGHSQSAIIISEEISNLDSGRTMGLGQAPAAGELHFILTGDPSNPNGGLFTRFPGLDAASEGTNYDVSTPPDSIYQTDIYTLEYDGTADFPKYPLNFLADLNAVLGEEYVHPWPNYVNPANVDHAFLLPGSAELTGDGSTNYWMMSTENLPLLDPLRDMPIIGHTVGTALADLLQPDLRILVNLGYGSNPAIGWASGPANVDTQLGLFPDANPATIVQDLIKAFPRGIEAALDDIKSWNLTTLLTDDQSAPGVNESLSAVMSDLGTPADPETVFTNMVNTLSSASSSAFSYVVDIQNILNFLTTSLPMYDVDLFVNGLKDGNLLDAFGLPLAAETGQLTLNGFGLISDMEAPIDLLETAIEKIGVDFMSLF